MLTLLVGTLALMTAAPTPELQKLTAEENAWHAQRIAHLTAEDGWLTLVGLDWLEEGESTAGSAKDAKVVLPASVPAQVGVYTRHGKQVSFAPASGVPVTLGGKPFPGGPVKTDENGDADVLRVGTVQLLAIVRGDRVGVRVRDSASAVRKDFKGIERFPVSAAWRKVATWTPAPKGTTVHIVNVLGQDEETPLAGTTAFTHEGQTFHLEAVDEDGKLFFVFGDLTNRDSSYPAGRFLIADPPGKDGHVVLDFNRAYNPPCAFTHFATCPLPSRENRMKIRVEAGEKRYAGAHE